MLNRAISETYPPGSTFKVVTTAAALQAGAHPRTPSSPRRRTIPLPGQHRDAGELRRRAVRHGADRDAARRVREVLQHRLRPSSASTPGADALKQHRRGVRPGRAACPIPLQVAESTVGPIADAAALGMSSIGQQDVALTPLQNAMVAATIANGGVPMQPYLVDGLKGPDLRQHQHDRADAAAPRGVRRRSRLH